jgi:hypothetical protein
VLQKTGFVDNLDTKHFETGEPSAILKIIHHLMFRASESFTEHVQNYVGKPGQSVHADVKFLPDALFYKTFTLILCDLFGYRVDLSPA